MTTQAQSVSPDTWKPVRLAVMRLAGDLAGFWVASLRDAAFAFLPVLGIYELLAQKLPVVSPLELFALILAVRLATGRS